MGLALSQRGTFLVRSDMLPPFWGLKWDLDFRICTHTLSGPVLRANSLQQLAGSQILPVAEAHGKCQSLSVQVGSVRLRFLVLKVKPPDGPSLMQWLLVVMATGALCASCAAGVSRRSCCGVIGSRRCPRVIVCVVGGWWLLVLRAWGALAAGRHC